MKTARSERFFDEEGRKEARDRLAALGIEGLVVIGGDGSFNGAAKLACETDIKVACIPGTIDNDLNYTDYTLGFDTAVNTVLNAVNNIRDTMSSTTARVSWRLWDAAAETLPCFRQSAAARTPL